MKAVQYTENSEDLSLAKITEVPQPSVKAGYALVKIQAAAANPIDTMVMAGYLKEMWSMPLPFSMGYDFSGVVTAIDGSNDFAVGDNVFAVNWGSGKHNGDGDEPVGGAFAEYISIPVEKLSKKPAEISHELAAATALVGTTAYEGLFEALQLKAGEKVLILGGPSSVGAIATQLAKHAGAWVAATHSTRTESYMKDELGASVDLLINYNNKNWEEELKDIDAVFDCVGETNGFERAKKVLKPTGGFVSISNQEVGYDPKGHPPLKYASFMCLHNSREVQDELAKLLVFKDLKVGIEKKYPFTDEGVQECLTNVKAGKSLGKHVFTF